MTQEKIKNKIIFKTPEQRIWYRFYEQKAKEMCPNDPRPFKKMLGVFSKQYFASLSIDEMKEFWATNANTLTKRT